ncbi:MAG TPA: adenosine deaminase [Terriglobales bacterium]|nr:adenosine deaminase [Terriglobales bacterium]
MSPQQDLQVSEFIRGLPKAELHLHLEGSVDPPTLAELSRRHNTPLRVENSRYAFNPDSGKELTESDVERLYRYTDFLGFLMAFKAVSERLRTPEDYELITYRLMRKLAAENVLHAEVYVSVGVIHWRGQEFAPIFAGLERGRERGERDFGVSLLWIFDATRHFGPEAALRVVEEAIIYRERGVVGFGIGGDEQRAGPELFPEVYAQARRHGLRLTCHAGESSGPESIAAAIDHLGAERIGHGLSAGRDPALMQRLAGSQIPIEVCLSSNLHTGCCAELRQHPMPSFLDHGMMVTLNTDDPEMFLTSLNREYQLAQQIFGLSDRDLRALAINSFRASFLPEERKQEYLALVGPHG